MGQSARFRVLKNKNHLGGMHMPASWRQRCAIGALALLALISCGPASAQQYPAQRITFVVAFAPGGVADTLARLVAHGLETKLCLAVASENGPAAHGHGAAR